MTTPGRISLDTPRTPDAEVVDAILIRVATDTAEVGLGLTYTLAPGQAQLQQLLDTHLSQLVLGEDPRDTGKLFARVQSRFKASGFTGLIARAYAALDIAFWDLKAKSAQLPLYRFLGNSRTSAPFFVSDLAPVGRSAADVLLAAKSILKMGALGLRVEIGGGDVQADADRIREIQDGLGDEGWLGVAADSRFDLGTAQALAHFFEDIGIDWFEDPIPSADTRGYAKLASLMEVPLAIGLSFDTVESFFQVIRDGVVRTIRPDICRLGGLTPLLKIAAVAEAFQVSVVPVRLPEIGVHLACGLGMVPQVDRVGWFDALFGGGTGIDKHGKMVPPELPGLGLTVIEEACNKYRITAGLSAVYCRCSKIGL